MATSVVRPGVVLHEHEAWSNYPKNVVLSDVERQYDVWNRNSAGQTDWRSGLQNLLFVIGQAEATGRRVRAAGATWSMAPVAASREFLINMRPLNAILPMPTAADLQPGRDPAAFAHVQAGTAVMKIHQALAAAGRSLMTTGATAGQTVGGSVATCTHGSRLDRAATADFVRGLHLITGAQRQCWVERASDRHVTPAFLAQLGPNIELIADDEIFDAAVISFGSFGVVHSLLVETEPLFTLDFYRRRRELDAPLRAAMSTLEFAGLGLPEDPARPYHFEVVINPYATGAGQRGVSVTTCYRKPARPNPPPPPAGGLSMGEELGAALGGLIGVVPATVPQIMPLVLDRAYPERQTSGTLGVIFDGLGPTGYQPISCELGIAAGDASRALDTIVAEVRASQPSYFYAGLIAFRYTRPSRGTLAFTRFDPTCTIELPALGNVGGTDQFFRRVWDRFDSAGIPFTLHWGQLNLADAGRVRRMYGAAVDRWIAARRRFMPDPATRRRFENDFVTGCGLGG
jgi:FAD/FMN-containing dehydrogenase